MTSARPVESELRGLWVDSWNPGILTPEECDETLRQAREGGFNALFIEIRKVGDALYSTTGVPRASNLKDGFDPLAYMIQQARSKSASRPPLQIHAWVVVYRIWKKNFGNPQDSSHVFSRHKDWLNYHRSNSTLSNEGIFLDPAHPGAQNHLIEVFTEIVDRYDIDGLHLDYIRYPGEDWGYSPTSLRLFREYSGRKDTPKPDDEAFNSWRRLQVTGFVRRLYGEIATRKPTVQLTAALIPWGSLKKGYEQSEPMLRAMQDWVLWKQQGYLDGLCLMNYKRHHIAEQARDFKDWCRFAAETPGDAYDAIGMGNYLNDLPGSLEQMKIIRAMGNDGALVYCYNEAATKGQPPSDVFRALKRHFFQTYVPPPPCSWKAKTGTLLLHLIDSNGQPRRYHNAILTRANDPAAEHLTTQTDVNGWTTYSRLEPGVYNLIVPKQRTHTTGQTVRRITIEAGKGQRVLTNQVSP